MTDTNKTLKAQNESMAETTLRTSKQLGSLKALTIEYELKRVRYVTETEALIDELHTENQNLRGMLTLGQETYSAIETSL